MDVVRFVNAPIEETNNKVYYRSCFVNNKVQLRVGDTVGFRLNNVEKCMYHGKLISIYEDLSVKTLNCAGSTLSPFKGEVLIYFLYSEIPNADFMYEENSKIDGLFVPLISQNSIIKGSLTTIELPYVSEVRQIVFTPPVNDSKLCYIQGGFDAVGKLVDGKKALKNSFEFAVGFLHAINVVILEAYRLNKRTPLNRKFKINEWLDSQMLKRVYPPGITSPDKIESNDKIIPPSQQSISSGKAISSVDRYETQSKKRKAASLAGDEKRQPPVTSTVISVDQEEKSSEISTETKGNNESISKHPISLKCGKTKIDKIIPIESTINSSSTPKMASNVICPFIESKKVVKHQPLGYEREYELQYIKLFIRSCLDSKKGKCLCVSGFPNSGMSVILDNACEEYKESSLIQFISIDCSSFSTSSDVLINIGQKLFSKKYTPKKLIRLLDAYYRSPHNSFTLLILDQFDRVCLNDQFVWYNLSEWFSYEHSKIIFIVVSNILDLPERLMPKPVSTRFNFDRLLFNPYSLDSLKKIVDAKFSHGFLPEAISYLKQRIFTAFGDMGKYMSIGEKSLEIARKKSHSRVTLKDVDEAFLNYLGSRETVIRSMRTLPSTILKCASNLSQKASDGQVRVQDVYEEVVNQYRSIKAEPPPSLTDFLHHIYNLNELGLIYGIGNIASDSKVKVNFPSSLLTPF